MSEFKYAETYWVVEFDHLQTGLFLDNETLRELEVAKFNGDRGIYLSDVYGVDFYCDPQKVFMAHRSSLETRHTYRLHNQAIEKEKQELGPWDQDD